MIQNKDLDSNNLDGFEIKKTTVKCEFCGFEFEKCDGISCNGCPMNCGVVKCPNCGYEVLPESKSYKFMEDSYKKIKNRLFR